MEKVGEALEETSAARMGSDVVSQSVQVRWKGGVAAEREARKRAIDKRIKEVEDAKRLLAETKYLKISMMMRQSRTIHSISRQLFGNADTSNLRAAATVKIPLTSRTLMKHLICPRARNLFKKLR